jgi:hypothetical protein
VPAGVSLTLPGKGAGRSVSTLGARKRARFAMSASCLKLTFVAEVGWTRLDLMAPGASVGTGACFLGFKAVERTCARATA